jgi:hypothetical protein
MNYDYLIDFPLRESKINGFLGEIENHMPENHNYRSNDLVTWAHETTHGLCARLRNKYGGNYDQKTNIFYLENNKCLVLEQPNFTISELIKYIPKDVRGDLFDLYLIKQQRYWNDEPLYILEECHCYLFGAIVGHENNLNERVDYSLKYAKEMFFYFEILKQHYNGDKRGLDVYSSFFNEKIKNIA